MSYGWVTGYISLSVPRLVEHAKRSSTRPGGLLQKMLGRKPPSAEVSATLPSKVRVFVVTVVVVVVVVVVTASSSKRRRHSQRSHHSPPERSRHSPPKHSCQSRRSLSIGRGKGRSPHRRASQRRHGTPSGSGYGEPPLKPQRNIRFRKAHSRQRLRTKVFCGAGVHCTAKISSRK